MPVGLWGIYLNESIVICISVTFTFIIKACIFFSSDSYKGMSQHFIIYFLSVLQFKYLRFYMYSIKCFIMRLPEVHFWNWHSFSFPVFPNPCPPSPNTLFEILMHMETHLKNKLNIFGGSILMRKRCSFKGWNKPLFEMREWVDKSERGIGG